MRIILNTENKNKFLNLRKQIEEFNIINEDRKIKDFHDPINKNKYLELRSNSKYLNLFSRSSASQINKSQFGTEIENDKIILNTENKNKFLNLRSQIEEFNIINEDRKIKDFDNPINKNKYVALQATYLKGGSASIEKTSGDIEVQKLKTLAEVQGIDLYTTWKDKRHTEIEKIKNEFSRSNYIPTATTFSDLYKWTMMPVIRKLEEYKGDITVTFGIDLREPSMRADLKTSHFTDDKKLIKLIHTALTTLEHRLFDKTIFNELLKLPHLVNLLDQKTIDSICGSIIPRTLVDRCGVKPYGTQYIRTRYDKDIVTVCFYYDETKKYSPTDADTGVHFIEATGPWHKVTWLETSMMQCVYEAKLRYDLDLIKKDYSVWIDEALLRCAKSIAYTRLMQKINPDIKPALFTGRRTGGLVFLMLQNMFLADHFKQFPSSKVTNSIADDNATFALGTSSVDCWYLLTKMNLPCLPCLNPVGTHAHELSMVTSVLYPQIDNKILIEPGIHLPITQIISHYLYYTLVWSKTKGPMPMLPDTLGTRAFMKAANLITVYKVGEERGPLVPLINVITSARQDSGELVHFLENMQEFNYTGPGIMASEIDTLDSLYTACTIQIGKSKYNSFGAGGFFGDSLKVWGSGTNNSMAVKAVRVVYKKEPTLKYDNIKYMKVEGDTVTGYPVKIGDPKNRLDSVLGEGKLSLDKNLEPIDLEAIKTYAASVRSIASRIDTDTSKPIHINTLFDFITGKLI